MALLRFFDGKNAEVSAATGARIWAILNGEAEPENEKEEAVATKVKAIYLNYHNAPDSYIEAHFDNIARMVVGSWMVAAEPSGNYQHVVRVAVATRPDPTHTWNIEFSKKWGLLDSLGRPTDKARRYM